MQSAATRVDGGHGLHGPEVNYIESLMVEVMIVEQQGHCDSKKYLISQ